MKNITRLTVGALLLSTVAACAVPVPSGADKTDWDSKAANQLDERLAEGAARSADAAETLAQVERARTAPMESSLTAAQVAELPPELQRPTTVEWTGPAAELVGEISRNIGYGFSVVGDAPPVDVMVSVSAVDEPAVKVLENVSYQIARFAEVFIDPNGKRVEFRFLSEDHAAQTAPSNPKAMAPNLKSQGNQPSGVRRHKEPLGK